MNYSVKENPKGTERRARTKSDIEKCGQILMQADNDISVRSIRDCIQLGKFNPSKSRPRALLVKLFHTFDVDKLIFYIIHPILLKAF